jgi:UDP-glucose 4-epimerase
MSAPRSILITGGCGFVGTNLVRYLQANSSSSLRVLDDLRSASKSEVAGAEVMIGNAGDTELLADALAGVDAVVHLASETGVAPSLEDPLRDFEGNATLAVRTLDMCRRHGVTRFVYASSGAALGSVTPPLHEEILPRPSSPYGAGKLAGEAYCLAYAESFDMHTVALRFSNVYGPHSAHKRNAIPNFIKACLTGNAITVYGDGSQTRDFIYVDDLCAAISLAVEADDSAGEIFQLGTGVETSVRRLLELIPEIAGTTPPINFEPRRAGEVYKSVVDTSKARERLGFEARTSLRDGLTSTTEWFRAAWPPTRS